jgi:hypothetical protein
VRSEVSARDSGGGSVSRRERRIEVLFGTDSLQPPRLDVCAYDLRLRFANRHLGSMLIYRQRQVFA